ncbi:inactive phospholipase C-like protein 2 isoform X2 [Bombina bombina]|uniref:inactive phospholipase C-like protein 2 isoform X2 n=1 Tax=Bombina bombina TaxID=8345 RepID=UPI00235B2EB1|nr:inactive phospholipase C-like protein 2 isoform X2 [Bombina bombina]
MADSQDFSAASATVVVGHQVVQDGASHNSRGLHVPEWGVEELVNGRCSEDSPQSGRSSRDHSGERSVRTTGIMKDGSRQRQKKTVSFSTMPNNRKINSTAACISFMMEGCEMKKVRSNSRMYNRFFLLDPDMHFLRWEPSKKDSEKAKLEIKAIREVRVGKKTPVLRSNGLADTFPEECAFSIIYGENYESLDLVASSADIVNTWVMGLRYLVSYGKHTPNVQGTSQTSLRTLWISSVFEIADIDNEGQIPVSRAIQLIKGLNPGMKTSTVELKFKEVQKISEKYGSFITCDVFVEAYCELCTRPEVFFLLVQFSSNKEYLDMKDLMIFMEVEQGMEEVNEHTSLEIINKYEPSKEGRERGYLTIDGFTRYLLSSDCHIFDPHHKEVCQDMTRPLSHYYINSAHSACQLEDHYWGTSDISGYIHALKMGCRSIELVVWDGPDNEPLIYLGLSMLSQVTFRSVISVIDKYAFETSEYPLILCLVVHCSVRQQHQIVQCLKKILGDKLYKDPPNAEEIYLPSPEQLKGKILIKGKKLPHDLYDSEGDVTDEDEGMEIARRLGHDGSEHLSEGGHRKLRLCKALSDLVNLCQSVKFMDFETSKRSQKYWQVCSFNEVMASRFANENPEEFVKYNKKFLSRVYPSSMRIDASNMNPQDFWKCGCQIVAMNYQTPGLMMDLNNGWFRQNGNCGYVLRPSIMREEVSYFSANAKDSLPGVSAQLLHIKIISGQNLPKPKGSGAKGDVVEPYVYVETHGIPADCAEHRTKTVTQNGDNPIFDESFEFHINLPELAILRFVVLDDDYIGDEFIAQYTIPFECLQTGFRHVPLQSLTGEFLPNTTLFVHIAITNRRGGGKVHKRGIYVRKGKKVREYTSTKTIGIKAIDEVFRTATQPLREATDLRENVQFIQASRTLIETSDAVYSKIIQVQKAGMGFHEDLHRIGAKEGLKGRKLQKAMESFAWNITVLKGQADLLKHAKNEAVDHVRQIHHAGQSSGISRSSSPSPDVYRTRGTLEHITEADSGSSTTS